jgi:hypothetical protein
LSKGYRRLSITAGRSQFVKSFPAFFASRTLLSAARPGAGLRCKSLSVPAIDNNGSTVIFSPIVKAYML